jgi:hypothetical protein
MSGHRLVTLIAAVFFLLLAGASLYRLLVGFPVTIGGMVVGQAATFFVLVISIALSLMLFRGHKANV